MITRMDVDGQHVYYDGKKYYPSATAVIGELWPYRGPPGVGEDAASIGAEVHDIMAGYATTESWRPADIFDTGMREAAQAHAEALLPYMRPVKKVHAAEIAMVSEGIGIGGTADLVCERDGRLCVLDWKTKFREPADDAIDRHHLQAAMYAFMWKELTGELPSETVIVCSWRHLQIGSGSQAWSRPIEATAPVLFGEEVMAAVRRVRGRLQP